ncbi:MAG: hypothetical protein H6R05_470 [Burkholderiaceae bacterium]|nr:hypothetical protein [Burkholderiaceae bacterium]
MDLVHKLKFWFAMTGMLAAPLQAWADVSQSSHVAPTVMPDEVRPLGGSIDSVPRMTETVAPSTAQTIALDDALLQENPALFAQVLSRAVEQQAWDVVAHLIPLYQQVNPRDETLLLFAQARLYHVKGHYAQAIEHYRTILNQQAELTPVRMYLAQALFENQDNEAAQFQFEKIQADHPPEPVFNLVTQYLDALQRRSNWRLDGSVNYLNDDNVNNASSDKKIRVNGAYTGFQLNDASMPQSGKGLSYGLNIAKDFLVSGHHALITGVNLNGKYYSNLDGYDDVIARVNVGYQWRTARQSIALIPFYQKRWFAGRAYSDTYGVRLNGSYLIAPNWQVAGGYEYGENRYEARDFLNGQYHFVSLSSSYTLNAQTQLFAGVDTMLDQTQDASDSSLRVGYRMGLIRDFPLNVSAQVQLGVANKLFDAVNFFGVRRDEREYGGTVTLWNRGWYWYGVMPKLNFEFTNTRSNISMYSYQKNRVYLTLDRRF